MILITYDIKDDKLRNKFSKFIRKYGYRLQYSVYEITHSKNMLDNIRFSIVSNFEKKFTENDSVIIIQTTESNKIERFGYAKHDSDDIILV